MAINKKDYKQTKHTGIKLHNNGIDFLFDFRIDGKRHYKRFKSAQNHTPRDRLKAAYTALEAFKEKITKDNSIDADTSATVDAYWEKVKLLPGKRGKMWSDKVKDDYQYYFNKYLTEIGSMKIRDVKPLHIDILRTSQAELSLRYKKKAFEILVPIFDLAIDHEIIDKSPIAQKVIPKRDAASEKKTIDNAIDTYKIIHKTLHEKFKKNPHHLAFFLFGFHGRRLGEVNTLTWNDINLEDNTYTIRAVNSKISKDLTFSLPNEIKALLIQFKGKSSGSDSVFNIKEVKGHYADIRTKSEVKEFTFHWMRNLYVSALAANGVSITHLSAAMGHGDGQTLKKYLTMQNKESTRITNDIASQLLSE